MVRLPLPLLLLAKILGLTFAAARPRRRCDKVRPRIVAVGQTRRSSCLGMSASPPTPDVSLQGNEPTLRAIADITRLFDYVIGGSEQRGRNGQPKRLGGR